MVYEHQPAKLAAFEGHFKTGPADLSLFGIPDAKAGEMKWNVAIPGGLSFLIHNDFNAEVIGLDRIAPEHRPPVVVPFVSYHLMVGLGFFFIGSTLLACLLWWRGTLFSHRWLMWVFVLSVPLPFVANEVGWVAAEVGRQPWSVYPESPRGPDGAWLYDANGYIAYDASTGLMTKHAASEAVGAGAVLGSIIMFGLIYALLFAIWIYLLNSKIQHGPEPAGLPHATPPGGLAAATAARAGHTESMTEAKEDRR
jgi:cytochrome d ubiquinol oxidase subunit I